MRWLIAVAFVFAVIATVEGKSTLAKLRSGGVLSAEVDASHLTENERGQWHVYSDTITQKAHEGISAAAASRAGASNFDLESLRTGTIWNDMPSGVETEEAAMIRDGHMDIDTWTRIFFVTGGIDDLVFNVHYGCLQHVHSMAPIQRREAKASAGSRIVFTNAQVRDFITGQMKYWWDAAVRNKANKQYYSWYLGHILHALQDSYPRGHVVRDSTSSSCGRVVLFQGYDAQHGNDAHKKGDFTPSSGSKESDSSLTKRYACAIDYSTRVLQNFIACRSSGSCNFDSVVKTWLLTDVYAFAAGAESRTAGGSAADFAKSGIASSGFRAETGVTVWGGASTTLYNPTSTKRWAGSNTRLCAGNGEIVSKAPTTTLGIKHYNEKPFRGYVNYQSP